MPAISKIYNQPHAVGLVSKSPLRFGKQYDEYQATMDWLNDIRAAAAAVDDEIPLISNGGQWKRVTLPPDQKKFTGQIQLLGETWEVERIIQYRGRNPVETKFLVKSTSNPNRFFGHYSLSQSPYTVFYNARLDQNHHE